MAFERFAPTYAEAHPVGGYYNAVSKAALENRKQEIENKFAPLEAATKAQNAMSYGNRMGNIGMFLRTLSQMPVAERQAYLADPVNRKNYMNMLEQFRGGINNPLASGNVLTPEFLSQFGLGSGGTSSNPMNTIQQSNPNPVAQMPAASSNNVPQQGNDPEPLALPPVNNQPMQVSEVPEVGTGYTPEDQNKQQTDIEKPVALSDEERSALSSQMNSNNQTVGKVQSARADGAATMDKFLMDNREDFSKAINDSIKYMGVYGRGKNWLVKLKHDQPESYANYEFVKTSLRDNLANQIKFMEHMGATNTQLGKAEEMAIALDKLDQSPETARKVINKSIKSLMDLSNSIYSIAEPRFPGVRRKLYGIPALKSDYLPTPAPEKSSNKATNVAKGEILVKSKDGVLGTISESDWPEAEKEGYKRM